LTETPYEEVTRLAFAEEVARTFQVEQPDPHTILLRGACPRCRHVMDYRITEQVVRRRVRLDRSGGEPETAEETMLCTCGADHPDRSDGNVGCGAYWNLKISES
jgi:hypothetical protein